MSRSIYVEVDIDEFSDDEIADACKNPDEAFIAKMAKNGWQYIAEDADVREAYYRDRAIASLRASGAITREVADFFFEIHQIAVPESSQAWTGGIANCSGPVDATVTKA